MSEILYQMTATLRIRGDTMSRTCYAWSWHKAKNHIVCLSDEGNFELYLDAFEKAEIRKGDQLIWIWDGEVAKYV